MSFYLIQQNLLITVHLQDLTIYMVLLTQLRMKIYVDVIPNYSMCIHLFCMVTSSVPKSNDDYVGEFGKLSTQTLYMLLNVGYFGDIMLSP